MVEGSLRAQMQHSSLRVQQALCNISVGGYQLSLSHCSQPPRSRAVEVTQPNSGIRLEVVEVVEVVNKGSSDGQRKVWLSMAEMGALRWDTRNEGASSVIEPRA